MEIIYTSVLGCPKTISNKLVSERLDNSNGFVDMLKLILIVGFLLRQKNNPKMRFLMIIIIQIKSMPKLLGNVILYLVLILKN